MDKLKVFLNQAFVLVTMGSCVFTLALLFQEKSWVLDLTRHFPLQYLIVQIAALIVLLKSRPKSYLARSLALLVMISLNAFQVCSYYWPVHHQQSKMTTGNVKILHMNVLFFNQQYKTVSQILKSTDADIVSLQEVTETWLAQIKKENALARFPYQLTHAESGNVLLSRLKLSRSKILPIEEGEQGMLIGRKKGGILVADIHVSGKPVTLINLHPPVPMTPQYAARYRSYYQQLAQHQKSFSKHKILFGDLNTTPWSGHYKRYLTMFDLKDARVHWGFYPTWNCFFPLFFIPIDHVFVTKNFVTLKQRTGPFIGSDHLPIYVELGLKP